MKPKRAKGPRLTLALTQLAPTLGDVDANLELHLRAIEGARAAGADLCLFPELSLTGYFLKDLVPEVAMGLDDVRIRALQEQSKDLDIVFGTALRSDDFRYYNAALYLSDGKVRHVHRKVYLPTYGMFDEQRYFAPGDRVRAFEASGASAGIAICEDLWHLSAAYLLFVQGAHLILCPSVSPGRGVESSSAEDNSPGSVSSWHDLCRTVAGFTVSYVAYCNRLGYEDGVNFFGGSAVFGPDGRAIATASPDDESTLVEIDLREVERQRTVTPLLRDEKVDFTLAELQRITDERASDPY